MLPDGSDPRGARSASRTPRGRRGWKSLRRRLPPARQQARRQKYCGLKRFAVRNCNEPPNPALPPYRNPRGFILGEQDVAFRRKFQHPEREYAVLRRKGAHWSRRYALSPHKNYTLGRNIAIWQFERQHSSREGVALRQETTHWSGPNCFFRREKQHSEREYEGLRRKYAHWPG